MGNRKRPRRRGRRPRVHIPERTPARPRREDGLRTKRPAARRVRRHQRRAGRTRLRRGRRTTRARRHRGPLDRVRRPQGPRRRLFGLRPAGLPDRAGGERIHAHPDRQQSGPAHGRGWAARWSALTFDAANRVYPGYNIMGTAKAALENEVRQLANEPPDRFGPQNVQGQRRLGRGRCRPSPPGPYPASTSCAAPTPTGRP